LNKNKKMDLLKGLTIKKLHEDLVSKKISALEITQAFFEKIKKEDKEIDAYLSLNEENAIKQAEMVDIEIAKGNEIADLAGIPLAIKDNILIKGLKTTAASKILENYVASYDATVIEKLKAQNAIFLGKTNMDEFAMGSSTENSAFKKTKNPYDKTRVPGGSSGGSAAAVAAQMAVASLGSDTGGSIREPASFCGVVGFKPTYGAVSRSGVIAMASSLDQIGPIAKTVEDAKILFKTIAGKDNLDATSSDPEKSWEEKLKEKNIEKIRELTIGIPDEYFISGISKEVEKEVENAIEKIKSLGIKFKKISLPHTKYALSCYYIIMTAEVSSNLARFDGIRYSRNKNIQLKEESLEELYFKQRGNGLGEESKRRTILGSFVLSSGYYDAYYEKAQRVRQLIKNDFDNVFKDIDVVLSPVVPSTAFKIGEKNNDPLQMYLSDIFTIPANLAGVPAISIPTKKDLKEGELPIGFQLIGKKWKEEDLFGIGEFYEKL